MIDKYAPALGSRFCSNPALLIHVYRYTLMVYRYTFATAKFLNRCTGTHFGCTGTHFGCTSTLCPLPLFKQGVPVHLNDVPVHLILWCFLALLEFPRFHQSFAHILNASYWLPGHKSLYTYALDLKDLHKSKNTKEIKSTYPHAECG